MDNDEEARVRKEENMQARRREMARFWQDTIRVYNPLYVDFRFLYDGYPNTVKARSYKDMERFRARLFFRKMAQEMIGQMQIDKGEELLKKRRDRGVDEILDKYQENRQIWDKVPRLDNKELLEQIGQKVIVGLVEEYGREEPLPEQRVQPRPDMTNVDENVFSDLANRKVTEETAPEVPEAKPITVKPLTKNEPIK